MDPFQVIQRGTDSSGRPLKNTAIKWQVFDKINARSGGLLVIVQGAFMGSAGADASAGTHMFAGCNDVRRWNLTAAKAAEVIDIADSLGDIWWERTAAQGFDPHFHNLLPNDHPLHPDAAWQVTLFRQGKNGLASGAPDMPGRRRPFPVYKFEEDSMSEADVNRLENKIDRVLQRLNVGFENERERDAAERERDRETKAKLVDQFGLMQNALKDDDSPSIRQVKQLLRENRKLLLQDLKDDPATTGTPNDPSDEAVDEA